MLKNLWKRLPIPDERLLLIFTLIAVLSVPFLVILIFLVLSEFPKNSIYVIWVTILTLFVGLISWLASIVIRRNATPIYQFRRPRYNEERLYLLKVSNGKVVEVGRKLWGKEEIFPIFLPRVRDDKFEAFTKLEFRFGRVVLVVPVTLTAHIVKSIIVPREGMVMLSNNFDAQEIYEKVIKPNPWCDSIVTWLGDEFKVAAEKSSSVRNAVEACKNRDIASLVSALQKAFQDVELPDMLISIFSVSAQIDKEHISRRTWLKV